MVKGIRNVRDFNRIILNGIDNEYPKMMDFSNRNWFCNLHPSLNHPVIESGIGKLDK